MIAENSINSIPAIDPRAKAHAELRKTIDEALGAVFFGPLLRSARGSSLKSDLGHGGRGEEVFRGQLDQILVERAGSAAGFDLGDVLFDRFAAAAEAHAQEGATR